MIIAAAIAMAATAAPRRGGGAAVAESFACGAPWALPEARSSSIGNPSMQGASMTEVAPAMSGSAVDTTSSTASAEPTGTDPSRGGTGGGAADAGEVLGLSDARSGCSHANRQPLGDRAPGPAEG
jgi:hypothetical protein